jgi:hypothetical protein
MTAGDTIIILVNWKLKQQTARCLDSLACLPEPHRILVVDNGSHDGSVEYFHAHYPQVSVLPLPENLGFGAACNRAIQSVWADRSWAYILLVNNDATLHPAALGHLLQAAQEHPQAGIFGPKMYYAAAPERLWYAGARRRWGVLAAADTGRGQVDRGQFDQRTHIDFVFGAGMFIRRAVLETVGLFDERFFLYLEDLDLCLRAQKTGFGLRFVPQARLWHQVSASTEALPDWRKYHQARSTVLFLLKHTSLPLAFPVLGYWLGVFLRFALRETLQGDLTSLRMYLSGMLHGLRLERERHWDG